MIKATIFDFGNVISEPQTGESFQNMEKLTGIPANVFGDLFWKYRKEFDLGNLTGKQMYSAMLADQGYLKESKDENLCEKIARIDMDSWTKINKKASDWALSLQSKGYKLGILSNMPTEFLNYYEKDIEVFTKADVAIFSCRVKMIKPDPAIYIHILNKLNINPDEAVFFDDIRENIEAAKKLGMHGIFWQNLALSQREFDCLINK